MIRALAKPPVLLGVVLVLDAIAALVAVQTHAAPAKATTVLEEFAAKLDRQYHECVPLGWFPDSRPWRGYVPGYNADATDKGALFQAVWVGVVPARTLGDPHAVAVKSVLDEFARLGLLARHELPDAFRYNLTHEGEQYYYERNHLGNNVEAWSYLCFSRLRARDVAWASRPRKRAGYARATVRFKWEPAVVAPWVTPFLKAHAVELNPTESPARVTALRYANGRWTLAELDFAFALVENPAAWAAAGRGGMSRTGNSVR